MSEAPLSLGRRGRTAAGLAPRSLAAWLARALAERPRAVRVAVLATIALTALFYSPALAAGYFEDDHFHAFVLREVPRSFAEELNLFRFIGSSDEVAVMRTWGLVPWWADDAIRVHFFRPLPSLTHWLDWQLAPGNPVPAHLISVAWYGLLIGLVSRVLARFMGASSWWLALAVGVFALDDAHALVVAWLAHRSDMIAAVFVLTAFLGWLRLREGKARWNAVTVVGGFVAALLSKESSVVFPALVLAHAILLPDDAATPLRRRLRPWAWLHVALGAIALAYLVGYFGGGYGAHTATYPNPVIAPSLWAAQLFRSGFFNAVILATGVPLHFFSWSPVDDHPALTAICAVATIGFCALAWRLLRRDRAAGFFAAWILIAQPALVTKFPDPRLLLLPSIGVAYLVARMLQEAHARRASWWPARPVAASLVGVHLIFAPIVAQVCLSVLSRLQERYEKVRGDLTASIDYGRLPDEGLQVFFLNWHQPETTPLGNLYLLRNLPSGADMSGHLTGPDWSYRESMDRGFAAMRIHYYTLSFLPEDAEVRVLDERQLTIASRSGDYFPSLFEQLYLTTAAFRVGQRFELPRFTATIDALGDDGEVSRVRFTFPEPLSSPSYRFMAWSGDGFVRLDMARAAGGRLAIGVTGSR